MFFDRPISPNRSASFKIQAEPAGLIAVFPVASGFPHSSIRQVGGKKNILGGARNFFAFDEFARCIAAGGVVKSGCCLEAVLARVIEFYGAAFVCPDGTARSPQRSFLRNFIVMQGHGEPYA